MENIEPVQKTEYQLVIEDGIHDGHAITMLNLRIEDEHQIIGIASGYGGLSEYFPSIEEAEKHFRLLAAAPLLLSALIKFVEDEEDYIRGGGQETSWYKEAKAAIDKALNIKTEQP